MRNGGKWRRCLNVFFGSVGILMGCLFADAPAGAQAQAPTRPAVTVMDLQHGGPIGAQPEDLSALGAKLKEMLIAELSRSPRTHFDVIRRDSVPVAPGGSATTDGVRLRPVRYLVTGNFISVGSSVHVRVQVVDVATGNVFGQAGETVARDELAAGVARIAARISEMLEQAAAPRPLP